MAQPGTYAVASNINMRADLRQKLIIAAAAGVASATNSSGVATYTASTGAAFAVALADQILVTLVSEGG